MSEEIETVTVGGVKFVTAPGVAQIRSLGGDFVDLSADDLGSLAEFIADAWFNLEGEYYAHGYDKYLRSIGHPFAERDCE